MSGIRILTPRRTKQSWTVPTTSVPRCLAMHDFYSTLLRPSRATHSDRGSPTIAEFPEKLSWTTTHLAERTDSILSCRYCN